MRLARLILLAHLAAAPALAQTPADPLIASIGLSFLATHGNVSSATGGLDVAVKSLPAPWGFDVAFKLLLAERDDERTAERTLLRARAERSVGGIWSAFLGGIAERDRFAELDSRLLAEGGFKLEALRAQHHSLSFDAGVTWTREDIRTAPTASFVGATTGIAYSFTPRPGTSVTQRLLVYPSFEDSSDWRLSSESAVQTSLVARLAVKVGFLLRYDHMPAPQAASTDSTTTISLVVTL